MSEALTLRPATPDDLAALAQMNRELIEDEGADNPMTESQLRERMEKFLETGWGVTFFASAEATIGYALHRFDPDETEPSGLRVYVRHYYICRDQRGKGFGRQAFLALTQRRDWVDKKIVVESLVGNRRGLAFWKAIGFTTHAEVLIRRG